jgi:hypothetical protein
MLMTRVATQVTDGADCIRDRKIQEACATTISVLKYCEKTMSLKNIKPGDPGFFLTLYFIFAIIVEVTKETK